MGRSVLRPYKAKETKGKKRKRSHAGVRGGSLRLGGSLGSLANRHVERRGLMGSVVAARIAGRVEARKANRSMMRTAAE